MANKSGPESLGAKIRRLREKEGLTVGELAAQVDVKPSYLESIEADKVLPPVGEIIRLARTLSVELSAFMSGEEPKTSAGKRRKALSTRTRDYAYENLTTDDHEKHLMAFRVTIDPKSKHRRVGYRHEGEEFIYLISGRLKITVGKKTSLLGVGESIHFDSGEPHHLSNPGAEPTRLVVVIYTP